MFWKLNYSYFIKLFLKNIRLQYFWSISLKPSFQSPLSNIFLDFLHQGNMGLLKSIMLLAIGAYGGVYACQNYDIPRVDDPQNLLKKVQDYLKQFEKPKWKGKTTEYANYEQTRTLFVYIVIFVSHHVFFILQQAIKSTTLDNKIVIAHNYAQKHRDWLQLQLHRNWNGLFILIQNSSVSI